MFRKPFKTSSLKKLKPKGIIPRKGGIKRKAGHIQSKKADKKEKVWPLSRADTEFRQHMLETVPIKCVFPDCPITDPKKLTVSHYHGRVNKGTRFEIKNCDFICRNHHYWDKQLGWEFQKQTKEKHGWDGRYTVFMRQKLGAEYITLKAMAESGMKQKTAITNFQAKLQELI